MTTICLLQCNTSPLQRVDQVIDCGLWNVGPLVLNGYGKLMDIELELVVVLIDSKHPMMKCLW